MKTTDADTALVAAVVDSANLKSDRALGIDIGSGDFLENRVEQRNHVHVAVISLVTGIAVNGRSVDDGEVKLFVGSAKFDHQIEHLVDGAFRVGVGTVDLVHDDDDAQAAFQSMGQNETRLRLGALVSVNDEQCAIGHVQNALDLAAEVGMARGVDDVDLHALVRNSNVLGKDGDAALTFLIVRVQNAFLDFLILTECVRGPQKTVNQGGFAVINVGDDCNVAQILLLHSCFFPSMF